MPTAPTTGPSEGTSPLKDSKPDGAATPPVSHLPPEHSEQWGEGEAEAIEVDLLCVIVDTVDIAALNQFLVVN